MKLSLHDKAILVFTGGLMHKIQQANNTPFRYLSLRSKQQQVLIEKVRTQ